MSTHFCACFDIVAVSGTDQYDPFLVSIFVERSVSAMAIVDLFLSSPLLRDLCHCEEIVAIARRLGEYVHFLTMMARLFSVLKV